MTLIIALLLSGSMAKANTLNEAGPMEVLESISEINWQRLHRQGRRLCATVRDRHSLAVVYTTQPQMLIAAHQAFAQYTSDLQRAYLHVRMTLLFPHPYGQEGRQLVAAMELTMMRLQKQMAQFEHELSDFEGEFDGLVYGAKPSEPRRSLLIARCRARFTKTEVMLQQSHHVLFGEMHHIIPLVVSYDAHFAPPHP